MKRIVALLILAVGFAALAADEAPPAVVKPGVKTRGMVMDYGPFLASSLAVPGEQAGGPPRVVAYKSVNIKLGEGAYVAFDTELMRYAAGWTGGWLDLSRTHMVSSKGEVCPRVGGPVVFET